MNRRVPHQQLDKARNVLDDWNKMTNHIDKIGCSGKEESCRMKNFHASIQSLETDKTISGVLVMDKHPVKAAGLNARTRWHLADSSDRLLCLAPRIAQTDYSVWRPE